MRTINLLPPENRNPRQLLLLYPRLWRRSLKYNRHCPPALPIHQRLRLHFTFLDLYWSKVVEFQLAVGLEAVYFCPRDLFEMIHVVTRKARRDLRYCVIPFGDTMERWEAYLKMLSRLNYEINPYEFAERCSRCHRIIGQIIHPRDAQGEPVKMDTTHFFRLAGGEVADGTLKMAEGAKASETASGGTRTMTKSDLAA